MIIPLDPHKFLAAWNKVNQEHAEISLDLAMVALNEPALMKKIRNPTFQWVALIREEFPDQIAFISCVVRFTGILTLVESGQLGVFVHPEHGIWTDALRILAEAPCDLVEGYYVENLKSLLATLEPPPCDGALPSP